MVMLSLGYKGKATREGKGKVLSTTLQSKEIIIKFENSVPVSGMEWLEWRCKLFF